VRRRHCQWRRRWGLRRCLKAEQHRKSSRGRPSEVWQGPRRSLQSTGCRKSQRGQPSGDGRQPVPGRACLGSQVGEATETIVAARGQARQLNRPCSIGEERGRSENVYGRAGVFCKRSRNLLRQLNPDRRAVS
jgi:hypothetical protein